MIKQIKFKLILLLVFLCLPRGVVAACEAGCAGVALCSLCCLASYYNSADVCVGAEILEERYERQQDFIENGDLSPYRPVPRCCLCRLPGECVCCFCGCWCERQGSGKERCVDCECPFDVFCSVCDVSGEKRNDERCDALRRCCGRNCCPCYKEQSDETIPLISRSNGTHEMAPINVVSHFVQPPGVIAAAR